MGVGACVGAGVAVCAGAVVGSVVGCAVCRWVGDGVADSVAVALGDAAALALAVADGLAAATIVGVGAALVAAGRVIEGCPSGVAFTFSIRVCWPGTHAASSRAAVSADTGLNKSSFPPSSIHPPSPAAFRSGHCIDGLLW